MNSVFAKIRRYIPEALILIISSFFLLYQLFFQPSLGWDYPTYIISFKQVNGLFFRGSVYGNSILFTFAQILSIITFSTNPEIIFKTTIFLIYIALIITCYYLSKIIMNLSNGRNDTNDNRVSYYLKKFSIILLFVFSPYTLFLTTLYRQLTFTLFLFLFIVFQMKFWSNNEKWRTQIKFLILSVISLFFMNVSSVIASVFIVILYLFPLIIHKFWKENQKIYLKKTIYYYGSLLLTFILSDVFSYFSFYNPQNVHSHLSPASGPIILVLRTFPSIFNYIFSGNILNQYIAVYFVHILLLGLCLLSLKIKSKLTTKKLEKMFNLTLLILMWILIFYSVIIGDSNSQERGGYPFSLFYLWGGWLILILTLTQNKNISVKERIIQLICKMTIIVILIMDLALEIIQILFTNIAINPTSFPVVRIQIILVIPLAIIGCINIRSDNLNQIKNKNLFVTVTIGLVILIHMIITKSFTPFEIFFQIKSLSPVLIILIWLVITGTLIDKDLILKMMNKLNYRKISFKFLDKKSIKTTINYVSILALFINIIFYTILAFGLPPVIENHEADFVMTIENITPENSTLFLSPHQYTWFEMKTSNQYNLISLTTISTYFYAGGYNESNLPIVEAMLTFLETPTNLTFDIFKTTYNDSFYLWISFSDRYLSFIPIGGIDEISNFLDLIIVDEEQNNYLLFYE